MRSKKKAAATSNGLSTQRLNIFSSMNGIALPNDPIFAGPILLFDVFLLPRGKIFFEGGYTCNRTASTEKKLRGVPLGVSKLRIDIPNSTENAPFQYPSIDFSDIQMSQIACFSL